MTAPLQRPRQATDPWSPPHQRLHLNGDGAAPLAPTGLRSVTPPPTKTFPILRRGINEDSFASSNGSGREGRAGMACPRTSPLMNLAASLDPAKLPEGDHSQPRTLGEIPIRNEVYSALRNREWG